MMRTHHIITKCANSDGHTYMVKSVRGDKLSISTGRAGLPEKITELFNRLIEQNEKELSNEPAI